MCQDRTRARTTMAVVGSCVCLRLEAVEPAPVLTTLTRRNAIAFHCSSVAGSNRANVRQLMNAVHFSYYTRDYRVHTNWRESWGRAPCYFDTHYSFYFQTHGADIAPFLQSCLWSLITNSTKMRLPDWTPTMNEVMTSLPSMSTSIAAILITHTSRRKTVCQHSTAGRLSFPASIFWNTLPNDVQSAPSVSSFRRQLKAFLFHQSFPDILVKISVCLLRSRGLCNTLGCFSHVKNFRLTLTLTLQFICRYDIHCWGQGFEMGPGGETRRL